MHAYLLTWIHAKMWGFFSERQLNLTHCRLEPDSSCTNPMGMRGCSRQQVNTRDANLQNRKSVITRLKISNLGNKSVISWAALWIYKKKKQHANAARTHAHMIVWNFGDFSHTKLLNIDYQVMTTHQFSMKNRFL